MPRSLKEDRVGLVLGHKTFHVGAALRDGQDAAVVPQLEKLAVVAPQLLKVALYHFRLCLLRRLVDRTVRPLHGELLGEIPSAARVGVETGLHAVLSGGVHEVTDNIPLAAAPRALLEAVREQVALPLHEAAAVACHEHDILRAHRLGRLHPLVGVELGGIVDARIQYLLAVFGVDALPARLEDGKVHVEEHAELLIGPKHLLRGRFHKGRRNCAEERPYARRDAACRSGQQEFSTRCFHVSPFC